MRIVPDCCVPGCESGRAHVCAPHTGESLCAEHFARATARSRQLWQSAAGRLARLHRSWDDERVFAAIAARSRHLAFCALLEAAHDHADWAWKRLRSEILGATVGLAPGSPEIAPISDLPDHRLDAGPNPLATERRTSPAIQK